MTAIDVQKLNGGALLSNGSASVGVFGAEDPSLSPIAVYIDSGLTVEYSRADGQQGVELDLDGFPVNSDGARANLYTRGSYSIQLFDKLGGAVWGSPRQVSLESDLSLYKTGTLASPPSGLEDNEPWLDETDSSEYPIIRGYSIVTPE